MKYLRAPFRAWPLSAAALVLTLSPAVLRAQSLVELYEAARGYDATYLSAKSQFDANLAHANQALGGILPSIGWTTSVARTYSDVRYDNPTQAPAGFINPRVYGTTTGAITLSQPLYRPALWAAYRQGGRQMEQAAAQYEAAEQDLLVRVSQAYFDVLNAQDTLNTLQAQKKAVGEQLAAAKRNFEVGVSNVIGVRDAEARYDLATTQEIAADNDLRVKRLALDQLVGLQNTQPKRLAVSGKLVEAPSDGMETWVSASEASSPVVRQAQLALEIAQLEVDKAVAGHKPTVDAQISYAGTVNTNGTSSTSTSAAAVNTHVFTPSAQIVLAVPLFAGFATQYRVQETTALENKARADLDAAKRTTAQATRTAYLGLIAGLSQVKAYEAAEASSQSSLDANKLGYSVGVNINIDVLNSQSQLYQTKRDLAKARYDVLMGSLRLRQATGTLTPQDLLPINALLQP